MVIFYSWTFPIFSQVELPGYYIGTCKQPGYMKIKKNKKMIYFEEFSPQPNVVHYASWNFMNDTLHIVYKYKKTVKGRLVFRKLKLPFQKRCLEKGMEQFIVSGPWISDVRLTHEKCYLKRSYHRRARKAKSQYKP
jgi:hypothetical protein